MIDSRHIDDMTAFFFLRSYKTAEFTLNFYNHKNKLYFSIHSKPINTCEICPSLKQTNRMILKQWALINIFSFINKYDKMKRLSHTFQWIYIWKCFNLCSIQFESCLIPSSSQLSLGFDAPYSHTFVISSIAHLIAANMLY